MCIYIFRSKFFFACEDTFQLAGRTSQNDPVIRCSSKGYWDFGDLRCEGPVCADPGHAPDGTQLATSYEHGSKVNFNCNRPGFVPITSEPITCIKGADCKVIKPLGIASGAIPDSAFNATSYRSNYEPNKVRLNSVTGWCAVQKDAQSPYLNVDLGRVYRIKSLLVKGVVTNDIVGRPIEIRIFYKLHNQENFVVYFPNFNLTSTEPGNYGELSELRLPTTLVARYLVIFITKYHKNPCLKFEILGCEDQKDDILLGYDKGYPICVDKEPPKFENCPSAPIMVTRSSNGILPLNFTVPTATDNSGIVPRVEVRPLGFKPPIVVFEDTSVEYTAFDHFGNVATCVVNITVPDTTAPVLHCPQSYVAELIDETETYRIDFNETRRLINATDESGAVIVTIDPEIAVIPVKGFRNITVTASDRFGNKAYCHFQVSVQPRACVPWSLAKPANGEINCRRREQQEGYVCVAKCHPGYRFIDSDSMKTYECEVNSHWKPNNMIPDCVPEPDSELDDSNYDVNATVQYRSGGFPHESCISVYSNYVAGYFESLNRLLSERCSAMNVEMAIQFFNTTIVKKPNANELSIEYILRIDPVVRRKNLYDLCGTALSLVFDLSVPSTSLIIDPLLNISAQQIGGSCPSLMALKSQVTRGFTCRPGEILLHFNSTEDRTNNRIPRCLQCAPGTYASKDMKSCLPCPLGEYQDASRQPSCRECPKGTYTRSEGSKSMFDCIPVCGFGTHSPSGMVPCLQCPQNTYSGPPPREGFKECQKCVTNTFTYSPGATSINECKIKCAAGTYSETGLEHCSACPTNYYQEKEGQTKCSECPLTMSTLRPGALLREACSSGQCSSINCQNGGVCIVTRHEPYCHCPAGFTGQYCEVNINECASEPCYNGGVCTDQPQGYTCRCPPGFSGLQCQNEREECGPDTCPSKAMCQNAPGINNVNCLCKTGYEGQNCNVTINPCSSSPSPCENSGACVPLLQVSFFVRNYLEFVYLICFVFTGTILLRVSSRLDWHALREEHRRLCRGAVSAGCGVHRPGQRLQVRLPARLHWQTLRREDRFVRHQSVPKRAVHRPPGVPRVHLRARLDGTALRRQH